MEIPGSLYMVGTSNQSVPESWPLNIFPNEYVMIIFQNSLLESNIQWIGFLGEICSRETIKIFPWFFWRWNRSINFPLFHTIHWNPTIFNDKTTIFDGKNNHGFPVNMFPTQTTLHWNMGKLEIRKGPRRWWWISHGLTQPKKICKP